MNSVVVYWCCRFHILLMQIAWPRIYDSTGQGIGAQRGQPRSSVPAADETQTDNWTEGYRNMDNYFLC